MSGAMLGVSIVLVCTVIEGFAQVFLKLSALRTAVSTVRYSWIALGIGFYIVEVALYTVALRLLTVSTAFAISSLSFVTVAVLAAWLLREQVTPARWAGILLILFGVTLIVAYA
ncbi:MAG TPA: EamA family transporter [Xanthobacteraceae bacterium]|nr:EamA family transporter [Xanthobacteraceae bacterium]